MASALRDVQDSDRDDELSELESIQEAPEEDASDRDKANYTFGRWTRQREHFYGLYKLWSRCILFLLGKQWLEWDAQTRRWTPEQNVPKWRQRPITNLVFAVYRSAIAKLIKQKPSFDVVPPRTGDSEDREAARLGESLLQQLWRSLAMPKLLAKAAGWLLATGNIAVRVYWDAEGGKLIPRTVPVTDPITGEEHEVAADENGNPARKRIRGQWVLDLKAEPEMIFEGEVAVELVSPISIRYNPEAKSKDDAYEYFIGYTLPKATAMKKWELDEEELEGGSDDELESVDDLIANAAGATEILGQTSLAGDRHESIGERVLVIEYYRKPCDDYQGGRHWITVNKTMALPEETLPNGFWPPVVEIDDVPVPGDPHAMGLLSQVCPLNREYNVLNGKIGEHNVMMAMGGKWIVHPFDKNLKITSDPGQKLESKGYVDGKPPVQVEIKTLPAGVYQERQRILDDLMLVSGMNNVGMGQKPEGVSSGRGFLVLQESVDSVLTPTLFNIENGLQEIGRRMLVLARDNYTEERILKVRGHNGRWEIRSFMGADLGDSIDVQVQVGSMFPWSKAARQDMALDIVSKIPGLVAGEAPGSIDPLKLSRILDVGGIQAFELDADPDETEVMLEHAQFEEFSPAKGVLAVPQPGFWQNHARHYDEHIRVLKADRSRFERWDPQAQQLFVQHILAHRALIEQAAGNAAAAAGGPVAPNDNAGGAPGVTPPPGAAPGGSASAGAGASLQPSDFAAAGV